jgi:hypothetical protein
VVEVDVMGRFDMEGWRVGGLEGGRVWFGLVWNQDLGKARGVEISLIIRLIIKKYINFIINI